MDMTETIQPRSDQANADDFLAGPQTVTVAEVRKGASAEQPVDIVLAEFGPGRPFKPSKTVRRILVAGWGAEAEEYVGRRMTLYCDPDVKFGGATVGGIRVSHMSDIGKPLNLKLTTTRGKRAPFTVQPLPDAAPADTEPWRAQWQAITNALTAAGYEGDGKQMLNTAGEVIGATWPHPNKISPEDAQKILAAVREDNHQEATA